MGLIDALTACHECWWHDEEVEAAITAGVAQGWLRRTSLTQVEWTEAGCTLAELDPSQLACVELLAAELASRSELELAVCALEVPGAKANAILDELLAELGA